MYMSEKTMQILDGIVDMYLSDFKYGNNHCAFRLSKVPRFFETCARNHLLAAKQAEITLRHLLLPNHLECCTKPILNWIAKNLKRGYVINIMDQYYPCWKATEYDDIARPIKEEEFLEAVNYAKKLELTIL
jgi:putative pyruvate formate lyase activating enzyme